MNLRSLLNKTIILTFFALAGFLLAKSLYYGTVVGSILAIIGIIAWAMFLYTLNSIHSEQEEAETENQEKTIGF